MPTSRLASFGGWFIIAIALMFGAGTLYSTYTISKFHDRIEHLESEGELVSLDELIYKVETETDDAIYYLDKIAAMEIDYSIIPRDEDGEILTDEQSLALFEKFEKENQQFFEIIELAVNAPEASIRIPRTGDFDLEVHQMEEALEWKLHALIGKNDGQSACEVAIEIMQLAEKIDGPFLMKSLLAMAFRVQTQRAIYKIATTGLLDSVDSSTLDRINDLLESADPMASYVGAIKAERSAAIYHLLNSDYSREYKLEQSRLAKLTMKIPSGQVILAGNTLLNQLGQAIENGQQPLTTDIALDKFEYDWNTVVAFGGDVASAFNKLRDQFGGEVAMNRVLRILLAFHTADDAADRDSWSPEYLQSIGVPKDFTIDPYTGDPMTIKRVNNQWLVYSCGYDHTDDGGDCELDLRYGFDIPCEE